MVHLFIYWTLLACAILAQASNQESSKFHFVLVHGAGHGAWCWYKVTQELEEQGHKVDALDLTSAGTSGVDALAVDSLETYSVPLVQLLESLPPKEKVILVGHSLAGLSLTYAMEKFPERISGSFFVTALMLSSNATQARRAYSQITQGLQKYMTPLFRNSSSSTPAASSFKLQFARQLLYQKSPPEDVVLAKSILKPFPILDPAVSFTAANYGSIPRYFIKATKDRTIPLRRQEDMIKQNPPQKVLELHSDHSPFFSMPKNLVHSIMSVVKDFVKK
ncbi:putative methylesterase 13, chloroplastic [Selaginella moellendorffii]|uniref:putative methylesterase 13, chloroplastic n=1 Tax=Selaginella moellendorffii TaxID=88036 RepID=UPI000D1C22AE|nr:putative methylesterase 13, chloroplastic [Selaginella moellendorffii]|eukprot:XP_024522109.1 putative methylesterase 13, chloroplastic [Selaginella moellendorffii]